MERLLEDKQLSGLLDVTTTEVCDHLFRRYARLHR